MATKAIQSTTPALTTKQAADAIVARAVAPPMSVLTDAQAELQKAIDECIAAEKALNEAGEMTVSELPEERYKAADARFNAAQKRVNELAERLPVPPRSFTDVVLRAQVAYCHADKDARGGLAGLSNDEIGDDHATSAQLIAAVLQFAGINFH